MAPEPLWRHRYILWRSHNGKFSYVGVDFVGDECPLFLCFQKSLASFSDVVMGAMASQITGVSIVYSYVCSGTDKKTSKIRVTGQCQGNSPEFPVVWAFLLNWNIIAWSISVMTVLWINFTRSFRSEWGFSRRWKFYPRLIESFLRKAQLSKLCIEQNLIIL